MWLDNFLYAYVYAAMQVCVDIPLSLVSIMLEISPSSRLFSIREMLLESWTQATWINISFRSFSLLRVYLHKKIIQSFLL